METDASDISSAAPNFGVKSRLRPHGKAAIYLVGSGTVLGARQEINKKNHHPRCFPNAFVTAAERNELSYLGNPPGPLQKQFIFCLTALQVLNYAIQFLCALYAPSTSRNSLDVDEALKTSSEATWNTTGRGFCFFWGGWGGAFQHQLAQSVAL